MPPREFWCFKDIGDAKKYFGRGDYITGVARLDSVIDDLIFELFKQNLAGGLGLYSEDPEEEADSEDYLNKLFDERVFDGGKIISWLVRKKILSAELEQQIRRFKSFRNKLVHGRLPFKQKLLEKVGLKLGFKPEELIDTDLKLAAADVGRLRLVLILNVATNEKLSSEERTLLVESINKLASELNADLLEEGLDKQIREGVNAANALLQVLHNVLYGKDGEKTYRQWKELYASMDSSIPVDR